MNVCFSHTMIWNGYEEYSRQVEVQPAFRQYQSLVIEAEAGDSQQGPSCVPLDRDHSSMLSWFQLIRVASSDCLDWSGHLLSRTLIDDSRGYRKRLVSESVEYQICRRKDSLRISIIVPRKVSQLR